MIVVIDNYGNEELFDDFMGIAMLRKAILTGTLEQLTFRSEAYHNELSKPLPDVDASTFSSELPDLTTTENTVVEMVEVDDNPLQEWELNEMLKKELVRMCEDLKLESEGTKAELIKRILNEQG